MVLNFETLELSPRPNQCLAAPEGLCRAAMPHLTPPVFPVEVPVLRQAVEAMLKAEPRIEWLDRDDTLPQIEVVQRTRWLQFADPVSIRFLAQGSGATLALYSRSKVGYSDLGTNRRRVERWLSLIPAHF